MDVALQPDFLFAADGDEEDMHWPEWTVAGLHDRGPAPPPEAVGHVRVDGCYRDADPGGRDVVTGDQPDAHAARDPAGVGRDAQRVAEVGDDLADGGDLQDRADRA